MTDLRKSLLYGISAVLLWSTIGSAFKITLRYIPFDLLLFYASAVSLVILFVIILIKKKLFLLRRLTISDLLHSAFLGLLNPFLYYLVLLKAYSLLLAQEAGTLNYICVLISFTGTIIIGTRGELLTLQFSNPLGVGLAIVSAVFWSLYWIFGVKDKQDEAVKLFLNFGFGVLYVFIYLLVRGKLDWPSSNGLWGAVYIGMFEMGITFFLWLNALKFAATTAKISNLVFLSPFISLIFIRYFVGESILPSTVAGLFLIISGILLQQFEGKNNGLKMRVDK